VSNFRVEDKFSVLLQNFIIRLQDTRCFDTGDLSDQTSKLAGYVVFTPLVTFGDILYIIHTEATPITERNRLFQKLIVAQMSSKFTRLLCNSKIESHVSKEPATGPYSQRDESSANLQT
jgi:hypothetical protein